MKKENYYITTPIYYATDDPHVGHALATVSADVIARYHELSGKNVYFLVGTDEYGTRVSLKAQSEKKDPQQFVDDVAKRYQEIWKTLNIKNSIFMRTTNPKHKDVVSKFIQKVYDKGDIYKAEYEGYYCVGCEEFKKDKDLIEGHCQIHRPDQTIFQREENYFFKLKNYAPEVLKLIESDEYKIIPPSKKNEIATKLRQAIDDNELGDLSISRENLDWGIRVPWDNTHAIYVWFDALLNYYSALKIDNKFEEFWPPQLHIVGKDISWFHSVIWLSMLLSAEEKLPKKLFVTSFFTIDGQKMSKSLGNVISPDDLVTKYGIDGTRYLLATSLPYLDDGDIGYSKFDERYRSDLSNDLGNLVSRVSALCEKKGYVAEGDREIPEFIGKVEEFYESCKIHEVIQEVNKLTSDLNTRVTEEKIWEKEKEEFSKVIGAIINGIRRVAYNLKPVMPETTENILATFEPNKKVQKAKVLFPRLDDD